MYMSVKVALSNYQYSVHALTKKSTGALPESKREGYHDRLTYTYNCTINVLYNNESTLAQHTRRHTHLTQSFYALDKPCMQTYKATRKIGQPD